MYDREKMMAAVLYILEGYEGNTDLHSLYKTFYIADKKSILDYGRMISGNEYIAMQFGPVPSRLDLLLKNVRSGNASTSYFGVRIKDILTVQNGYEVAAHLPSETRFLSRSDRLCLDHALEEVKGMNFQERTAHTHDYAWEQAIKQGFEKLRIQDMAIAAGGGEDCVSYLEELDEARDGI